MRPEGYIKDHHEKKYAKGKGRGGGARASRKRTTHRHNRATYSERELTKPGISNKGKNKKEKPRGKTE